MALDSPNPTKAWSFLTVAEDDRQHGGNDGYDDRLDAHYSWDSTVANHGGPQQGDICVVRDARGVLGVSRIASIGIDSDVEKLRRRCPACNSTAFKPRATLTPRYRCSCGNEFDEPLIEPIDVTVYRAEYADGWIAVDGALAAAGLETAYHSRARQHAIREVDAAVLRSLLADRHVYLDGIPAHPPRAVGASPRGGRRASSTWQRIGQDRFRRRLLERFGVRCLISGPQHVKSLHAAHLYSYAEDSRHDVAGGLLLRADLHQLFDAGLLGIAPDLTVTLDPELRRYPDLVRFEGVRLDISVNDPLLERTCEYLRLRAEASRAGLVG